ncbi:MAG: hypothetical protein IKU45_05430 [Clostridia bacterium]|nr:hypothetical protein [Clostridia bacterium]
MKKLISITILCLCLISLSGCTVNWFTTTYEVPWYYVAIPVALVGVLAHIRIMSGIYVCPKCNADIKLKWYQIYAYLHMNNQRFMICPNCKSKVFCKRKHN